MGGATRYPSISVSAAKLTVSLRSTILRALQIRGHLRELGNRIDVARRSSFCSRHHKFRLSHAVAVVDVDFATPQFDLLIFPAFDGGERVRRRRLVEEN